MPNLQRDVAIVGAGPSGLAAATALRKAGLTVAVIEARDRVGGRTWTDTIDGAVLEIGGQWVSPDQTALLAMVEDLGLETYPRYREGDSVFVTPDALGDRWQDGKLHGTLCVDLNGQPLGRADAGVDMTFDFGQLIAHAAKTRDLRAGTIIGSGTVSNRDADGGPGKPIGEGGLGYSCLAEVRTVETIRDGEAKTPFMQTGDTVRIWMDDERHHSIFGAIEQTVA